jgi:CRP/FNR family cyclic AMP-dependent transcriptional regulator
MATIADIDTAITPSAITIHLQKIPLFEGLSAETLTILAQALQLKTVDRGELVVQKGSSGDHLFFLLAGRLQVVDFMGDGKEIGLNFFNVGDYFGELSIIDGLPRSASVVATENSLVASLTRAHALAVMTKNSLIAERVLQRMACAVRTATNYRAILAIPNSFQRVFALLNQFAHVAPGGLVVIDKMPTQQEIAITVNTSRETVSRAIHILIQKGVVEKDMRRMIVRHPDALHKAATNDA